MTVEKVKKELHKVSSKEKAKILSRFFKTGKGEYGEGDKFIGVSVPEQRKIAKKFFADISLPEIKKLLQSQVHEHRFTALEILCFKFEKAKSKNERKKLVDFYLRNLKYVNNWDLVDTSSYSILGEWLSLKKDRKILYKLARSKNIWERRVSIVSTFAFIKKGDIKDAFNISLILLEDKHDLIQKSVGWMLREAGKASTASLESFIRDNYDKMGRTTLRYAVERFKEDKRKKFLLGFI